MNRRLQYEVQIFKLLRLKGSRPNRELQPFNSCERGVQQKPTGYKVTTMEHFRLDFAGENSSDLSSGLAAADVMEPSVGALDCSPNRNWIGGNFAGTSGLAWVIDDPCRPPEQRLDSFEGAGWTDLGEVPDEGLDNPRVWARILRKCYMSIETLQSSREVALPLGGAGHKAVLAQNPGIR